MEPNTAHIETALDAEFENKESSLDFTEDEMNMEREGARSNILEDDVDTLLSRHELLNRLDELAPRGSHNSSDAGELNPEERAAMAAACLDASLEASLKQTTSEEARKLISVPDEFGVLAKHDYMPWMTGLA
ncbi:hypothetical protein Daus18300_006354 [Diaporthe australafricana]|uniref:Uncharacterized protein n=1 Tax=Diaporthe australafricana TaxID=127596 RepID=A0ABR3WVU0_9PEZI